MLLSLIPVWVRIAALAAMLLAAFTWGHQAGSSSVQAKWDAAQGRAAAAALAEAQANAKETQRRLDRQKEAQDAYDAQIARARADASRATAAAGQLRQQLAAFTAAVRSAPSDTAAVGDGPTAGTALDLLAELFTGADGTAGVLAAALDASHAAGKQCERDYQALIAVP